MTAPVPRLPASRCPKAVGCLQGRNAQKPQGLLTSRLLTLMILEYASMSSNHAARRVFGFGLVERYHVAIPDHLLDHVRDHPIGAFYRDLLRADL